MKTKFFCIFLLYLEISRGDCNIEYDVSEQLEMIANILQGYNRDLDNSIKWKELKNANLGLEVEYHTDETISRMEKIRNLINGAADSYFESSHEIYDWARNVISRLTVVEHLKKQNRYIGRLAVVSQQEKEQAENSIGQLIRVRQKFSNASAECKNIIPYFDKDKLEKKGLINAKMQSGNIGGVFFGGPILSILSVYIVDKELVEVNNYFKLLYPRFEQAAVLIDDVVNGVRKEINRVTDLKYKTEIVIIKAEDNLKKNISVVDDNVKELLEQCNKYKFVHSS